MRACLVARHLMCCFNLIRFFDPQSFEHFDHKKGLRPGLFRADYATSADLQRMFIIPPLDEGGVGVDFAGILPENIAPVSKSLLSTVAREVLGSFVMTQTETTYAAWRKNVVAASVQARDSIRYAQADFWTTFVQDMQGMLSRANDTLDTMTREQQYFSIEGYDAKNSNNADILKNSFYKSIAEEVLPSVAKLDLSHIQDYQNPIEVSPATLAIGRKWQDLLQAQLIELRQTGKLGKTPADMAQRTADFLNQSILLSVF